jgi:Fungal specific transcription factor domain
MFENPISRTYDGIDEYGSDLVFPSPASEDLRDLHPSTVHIFRLWQKFLDSVNPLIKIFHAPTVQQQVLDATADLDNVPKEMEALMFGIYSMAIASFAEYECLPIFGEPKATLLKRYQSGARLACQRAGLLRSSDLTTLQGYVLYLVRTYNIASMFSSLHSQMSCLNFTMDPRSLFCLTGISVRIAQRMGLTFDGTAYGLSPFQVEMRRRLWWQILLLDTRVAELSGAGSTILNHTWTTKLPSNVNDSDLFPDMREPPQEHPGATEMVFVLHRCEVATLAKQFQDKELSLAAKDDAITAFENKLEKTYIQYCDPSIPFHLVTMLMVKLATAKVRMLPRHPHLMANISQIGTQERDYLFQLSLSCLESHNKMMALPSLERFMWFVLTNFPMPAHVYLLCSMRYQTTGELTDRAWELLETRFENQNMKFKESEFWRKNKDSLIHLAIANLTVKAWEAREKAFVAMQRPIPVTPNFIKQLQLQLAAKRPPKSTGTSSSVGTDATSPSVATTGIDEQFAESYQWFNPVAGDLNQGFDLMPGVMTSDHQPMGWDLWTDLMQPTNPIYSMDDAGVPLQRRYL